MEHYLDDSFAVTSNTILAYSGQHSTLKVPSRFLNIEVSEIGDGAFMDSFQLQCVMLPPTVRKIGESAFGNCVSLTSVLIPGGLSHVGVRLFRGCHDLRDVTIYDLRLTESEYFALKKAGHRSREGVYVLSEMPDNKIVRSIACSIDASIAQSVPNNIPFLFHLNKVDEEKGAFSLDKNIPVIGFSGASGAMTENDAFCAYIKSNISEFRDETAERTNDSYVRMGRNCAKVKTIIFTFDDTKTQKKKRDYLICATLRVGFFFWQSAQPVVYGKKKYYVYRRHYLSYNPKAVYVRRDIAMYTAEGLVKNQEEAKNVYAKYRLLSLL